MDDAPLQTHGAVGSDAGRPIPRADALAAILATTTRAEARALYGQHKSLLRDSASRDRIAQHTAELLRSEHAIERAARPPQRQTPADRFRELLRAELHAERAARRVA